MPGDVTYDDSRTVWNAMIDRKPALIARCLGTADVIACVQFAREHDLLLCIKGGGHNIAGLATADGALMLDLSLMRGVWVDRRRKVARAQAGCLLGDVDSETQVHGLAAVLGFVSRTGIAGLTLGGGFGYLTRRWGWTADTVVVMDLVTADWRVVRASSEENADLFWGLRGGGGNFGVVTGIDFGPCATIDQANQRMISSGVRLLLVIDQYNAIMGIITATDIAGEKPLKYLKEVGGKREDIFVRDIMTPQDRLEVLYRVDVENAKVGDIVETMKRVGRQHALVIDLDENKRQVVRGLFSTKQISKQLGITIEPTEVARTFAELEAALA